MCRTKRTLSVLRAITPVILIPFCIYMGVRQEKNTQNRPESEKSISTVSNNSNNVDLLPTNLTNHVSDVYTNMESSDCTEVVALDWTRLGNTLPTLDDGIITLDTDLQNYIYNISKQFNVPYELTLAVCYVESEFTAVINNAGTNTDGTTDWGIMGLNDLYLEANCDIYNDGIQIDPYNPYENIYIGVQILSNNYSYFDGNIYDTANAYNLGISGWENMKYNGYTWYYGDRVLNYIDLLKSQII